MSTNVLIIGQSGSGKSTSLRTLDPKSTFIINVMDKALPFKDYKKSYTLLTKDNPTGNYFASTNWQHIIQCIRKVNQSREDIKTIVIDDWTYTLTTEFMNRALEKGYDKFSELAQHAWMVINELLNSRSDMINFIIGHSDQDNSGKFKCKTIGKLLDEKVTIEGIFTIVLHSRVIDNQYVFQTQYDGEHLAKSPLEMFEEQFIPNDLSLVINKIKNYYGENNE